MSPELEDCERVVDASSGVGLAHIDVLVNNVGIIEVRKLIKDIVGGCLGSSHRQSNLKSAMLMSVSYPIPHLGARRVLPSIVNISSIGAIRGSGYVAYASSKAGLVGLTRDMAYSLGRDGIRVNSPTAPGHLHTPMAAA